MVWWPSGGCFQKTMALWTCAPVQVAEKRQILSLEVGDTEELGWIAGYGWLWMVMEEWAVAAMGPRFF
jgi:hypothetical protein